MLAVLGTPNAYHAKIMEAAGVEAAFIGTSITGGNYTGLPDTGVLSATECVTFDFQAAHPDSQGARRDLQGMDKVYELDERYLSRRAADRRWAR